MTEVKKSFRSCSSYERAENDLFLVSAHVLIYTYKKKSLRLYLYAIQTLDLTANKLLVRATRIAYLKENPSIGRRTVSGQHTVNIHKPRFVRGNSEGCKRRPPRSRGFRHF